MPPPLLAIDAVFDAAAFAAALAMLREHASIGAYQATTLALEQLLADCPVTEPQARTELLTLLAQIGRAHV